MSTKPGAPAQTDTYTLLTARLGSENFASIEPRGKTDATWQFFRYQLVAGGALRVHPDNGEFWKNAVTNKMVSGTLEKGQHSEQVIVSASGKELREFVLGYGGVIFRDDQSLDFRRADAR